MKQPSNRVEPFAGFGVLADDLTGAMDTGVGFARLGLDTVLTFGDSLPPDTTVAVLSTDSRGDDPETAYRKVRRQAAKFSGLYVYKKIDSTLRGNIGAELRAAIEALGIEKAVVCPAFPANQRAVVDGKLLVAGTPVDETSFAEDPVFPVTEAHIPTLLEKQSGLEVAGIGLAEVARGPGHLSRLISAGTAKIIVVDAASETHLHTIAGALAIASHRWLPCGSAGLAMELPPAFGFSSRVTPPQMLPACPQPALAVVGSRHEATRKQIETAESRFKLPLIPVSPAEFISPRGRITGLKRLDKELDACLNAGRSAIVSSTLSRFVSDLKVSPSRILAAIAARALKRWPLAGLFLSGGDVARAVCLTLDAGGIRILAELEPGVAVGELISAAGSGLRIVTKAGGFGSDTVIADAIAYLKGERR